MPRPTTPPVWTYMGVNIYRKDSPGHALRYTARTDSSGGLSADTLAGMRALIKDTLESKVV